MGQGEFRPPALLVVDDDPDSREMYAEYLARKGFKVIEAADGRTALARAFASPPDLAIVDLSLPDMDGLEAIQALRDEPRTAQVPVIVVSGYALGPAGGPRRPWDAYLSKPCAPDALVIAIEALLGARRAS